MIFKLKNFEINQKSIKIMIYITIILFKFMKFIKPSLASGPRLRIDKEVSLLFFNGGPKMNYFD